MSRRTILRALISRGARFLIIKTTVTKKKGLINPLTSKAMLPSKL